MSNYKPQEFAEMIGVSVKTLQRWDKEGKLKARDEDRPSANPHKGLSR